MAVGQEIAHGTLCGRATVPCRHTRVAVWPPVTRVSRDTRVAVLCRRSGQEILDPREFMKRAREEMGAQGIDEYRANNPQGGTSSFAGQGQSLDGQSVGNPLAPPPQEHTITFWQNGFSVDDGARLAAV